MKILFLIVCLLSISACSMTRTGQFSSVQYNDGEGNSGTLIYEGTKIIAHDVACIGSCAVQHPGEAYRDVVYDGPEVGTGPLR